MLQKMARIWKFAIVGIDTVAIIGEEEQNTMIDVNLSKTSIQRIVVPFSEIVKIEKRQTEAGKTIGLVLAIPIVVGVMALGVVVLATHERGD